MRWETRLWVSAALVVTTTALRIEHAIEQDLLGGPSGLHSTTPPGHKDNGIHVVRGSGEQIPSSSSDDNETGIVSGERTSKTDSKEQAASLSKSLEREFVVDASPNPATETDSDANKTGEDNDAESEGVEDNDDDDGNGDDDDGDGDDVTGDGNGSTGDGNGGTGDGNGGTGDSNDGNDNGNGAPGDESDDNNGEDPPSQPIDDVETTTGRVRGYAWRGSNNIIGYFDIQYGSFRNHFEAPVLPNKSDKIHEVTHHNKRCPQLDSNGDFTGELDCLTLSIFKSPNANNASVLVHIHEGNFINGSADPDIYGPEYLVSKGIILVLPNYRLGALGFLCLQNETAPGNAALKDLSLALSWIKDNVAKFGGNPDNIAVSGDGTAGALAGYLALSPMSKDNVSKVITESGSVLSYWAIDREPIEAARNLANRVGNFSSNIELKTLVTAAHHVILKPCVEKSTGNVANFMQKTPWEMIQDQEINITFMIGSAKYAGVHDALNLTEARIAQFNANVSLLLPNDLRFDSNYESSKLGYKVKAQYFQDAQISHKNMTALSEYLTDAAYLGPGIRTARSMVNSGATVYFYEFSFVGKLNRELLFLNRPVQQAVKGDIVGYLFTQDGAVPGEDTTEGRLVNQLITLWTNFLKTGTPSAEGITWNKLEKRAEHSNEAYLSITEVPTPGRGLYPQRLGLWTDIYNKHFIENFAFGTSPSVYTVLFLQFIFFIGFFKNASHFF